MSFSNYIKIRKIENGFLYEVDYPDLTYYYPDLISLVKDVFKKQIKTILRRTKEKIKPYYYLA